MQAIREVINTTMTRKGWSRRKLAGTIGLDEHTMARWCGGENESFKIKALIDLFQTAEMSMDKVFGIMGTDSLPATDDPPELAQLKEELSRYRWIVDRLRLGTADINPHDRSVIPQGCDLGAQAGEVARQTAERLMPEPKLPVTLNPSSKRKVGG